VRPVAQPDPQFVGQDVREKDRKDAHMMII
jgi:hypothetical protein